MHADKHSKAQAETDDYQSIAIANGILWALIFGFFALRYDSDPEQCLASDDQNSIITKPQADEEYEDVGYRFRLVFTISFYASVFQIVSAAVSGLIKSDIVYTVLFMGNGLMVFVMFMTWIYAFICRFSHSGMVCSGDYLKPNESSEGYLTSQGFFIKWFGYLFLTVIIASACMGGFFVRSLFTEDKRKTMPHSKLQEEEDYGV